MKWPEQRPVKELGTAAIRVDRELKRMMGELPDPSPTPIQEITIAEVQEAREKELERRRERDEREFLERKLADYEAVKAAEKEV